MKHMNKLTSAIRHRDNKYWVPSEGLNDASSGNCRIVILVPNECLKDSSRGKCGIIIQVPNECLKDSSSGKCGIIIQVPNECLKDSSRGKCGIKIQVPNECLKDSSRGKCRIIMPQSGVGATPHKGLITEIKDSTCHSRTSERRHIKGLYRR